MKPQSRRPTMVRAIRPRPRKEEREFGRAVRGFLVCFSCGAVYDEKRWKSGWTKVRHARETKRILFRSCPACAMIRHGLFEGEVIAKGIPKRSIPEAIARIRSVGRTAEQRDPLDRIIAVRRRGDTITVTTTENQLAVRIGKALRQLLGGTLSTRWSHEEDIVRVFWSASE